MKLWRWNNDGRTGGGPSSTHTAIGEVVLSATCTGGVDCQLYGLTATAITPGQVVDRCREAIAQQQPFVLGTLEAAKESGRCPTGHVHEALVTREATVADGMSVAMSGRLVSQRLAERDEGVGLFTTVLQEIEQMGHSVYLLGATPACLSAFRDRLAHRHPDLKIVGAHDGHLVTEPEELAAIVGDIRYSGADVVLAGMLASVREVALARRGRAA